MTLTTGESASEFVVEIPAGGSALFRTDETAGGLQAGYVVVNATAPLGGTLIFTSVNAGQTLAEAGVGSSRLSSSFTIPVLFGGVINTGIAIANILGEAVEVQLSLKNAAGQIVEEADPLNLGAGNHVARFASVFFDSLSGNFEGSIEVTTAQPVAAVALKQTSLLLTTFPTIELF